MRLDHVSYAVSPEEFVSTVGRLGAMLGAPFQDGGVHPRFGTRNFVLPLAGGTYLEVVAPLDHPATDRAPFGRAVKQRAELGGGWLGWVARVDDIAPVEERLGRPAVEGHRVRPDRLDLRWRQIGVLDLIDDPQLPYIIEWFDMDRHPSADARTEIRIRRLAIAGDPATVSTWLGEPENHPLDDVDVDWTAPDRDRDAGLQAVYFATDDGVVRVD
ncbi:VOC family protein [Yinghuangia sp. ASG 101]|uniref:VOC family protein n=1 Tax=Yinghuangia sp. ASG 101 TaxID=2896848 RepID=UPI001E56B357|nr:VOC family protein [Yinghuangia sp. ASG 101]UGQ10354.1 VOC family protein [Yinghuangia sp. ASG 101]